MNKETSNYNELTTPHNFSFVSSFTHIHDPLKLFASWKSVSVYYLLLVIYLDHLYASIDDNFQTKAFAIGA